MTPPHPNNSKFTFINQFQEERLKKTQKFKEKDLDKNKRESSVPSSSSLLSKSHTSSNSTQSGTYLSLDKPSLNQFDPLTLLATIYNRPNPKFDLGHMDPNCAFIISDAKKPDIPIVYSSDSFEQLTLYKKSEIIGRNCRFLQSPEGEVPRNSKRKYTDNEIVRDIKIQTTKGEESQNVLINYKKDGTSFLNLCTIIPIFRNSEIICFLGIQAELIQAPNEGLQICNFKISKTNSNKNNYQKSIKNTKSDININKINSSCKDSVDFNKHSIRESFQKWTEISVENMSDLSCVLDKEGCILFSTSGSKHFLEISPQNIIGCSIFTFCHPNDVPLLELDIELLKKAHIHENVFRLNHKSNGYKWVEGIWKYDREDNIITLVCRYFSMYTIKEKAFIKISPDVNSEFWLKISSYGLILYTCPNCSYIVGFNQGELTGTSLYEYLSYEKTIDLTRTLEQCLEDKEVHLKHSFRKKSGKIIAVETAFYCESSYQNEYPRFICCRIKVLNKKDRDLLSSNSSLSKKRTVSKKINTDRLNAFEFLKPELKTTWQKEYDILKTKNKDLRTKIIEYVQKMNPKNSELPKNIKCAKCQNKKTFEWKKTLKGNEIQCISCGALYSSYDRQ